MWVAQGGSHPGPANSPASVTFQPRQCLGEDKEKKEEVLPSFGSCRPLSQVADSGPKAKVNHPYILAVPSLSLYPRMCGPNPEPELRPGLSPVNPYSILGALMSRGRPHKGPADDHLLPEPRGQPQQVGLTEVLPGRVRNLPGPRTSRHLEPSDAPRQPLLQQRAAPPQVQTQQMGLADVPRQPLLQQMAAPSR